MWPFKPNVDKLEARRDVQGLIKALRYEKDETIRHRAAWALGRIGGDGAVQALCAVLQDPLLVTYSVPQALGRIGDARAVAPLCNALKGSYRYSNDHMRAAVLSALVRIGATAVEPLCNALRDKGEGVRQAAAQALGQIGDVRAVEPLCNALRDQYADVRKAAAEALGQIGDVRAVEPLRSALAREDWRIRGAAAEALARIGGAAVEPLCSALRDRDASMRRAAAEALLQCGVPQDVATQAWHAVAMQDWNRASSYGSAAVEPLCNALMSRDWRVRQAAAKALLQCGVPQDAATQAWHAVAMQDWSRASSCGSSAVEPLCNALRDDDRDVRQPAAEALVRIGAGAVEPLCSALRDGDKGVRQAAAQALGQIGDVRAVEPLCNALKDEDESVQQAAAQALGQIGDARAAKPLGNVLSIWDWRGRHVAAEALVRIGAAAVEPLCNALRLIGREDVHYVAAWALAQIGAAAVEPLCNALGDEYRHVRETAAQALGRIGDARAVEPLCNALRDGDENVRQAAAEALLHCGVPQDVATQAWHAVAMQDWNRASSYGSTAVEPLCNALGSQGRQVRQAAAEALVSLYRSGNLDEPARQRILALRDTMATPHTDISHECGHTDQGTGVSW